MLMSDLIKEMTSCKDLFIESFELLPTGSYEPVKKHHKKRIQKKWTKMYGMKPIYKKKKCKKIDVTLQKIIDFCQDHNFPLPEDINNYM